MLRIHLGVQIVTWESFPKGSLLGSSSFSSSAVVAVLLTCAGSHLCVATTQGHYTPNHTLPLYFLMLTSSHNGDGNVSVLALTNQCHAITAGVQML